MTNETIALETIEVNTRPDPDAAIIWLHGLGADGHDFEAIVPELNLPAELAIRFIFPHAPYRPITLNNGYVMRGWYDIVNLEFGSQEDATGIKESAAMLNELIENEIARGIPSKRIILAGFSQGGAIILYAGLRYSRSLAGLMALSSYLPLADSLSAETDADNRELPIFMGHGLQDDIIKYEYGIHSRLRLEQSGYGIEWHDYPMSHSVCLDEIRDIRQWIIERLT